MALGAMAALGAGLSLIPQWRRVVGTPPALDAAALAKALVPLSRDERADVGRAILSLEPQRRHDRELVLASKGLLRVRADGLAAPRDLDRLVEILIHHSKRDFAQGHVLLVNRWYLARTQADVLAIAASAPAPARAATIGAAS